MLKRWSNLVDAIKSNYWLVPSVMATGGAALAALTVHLDRVQPWHWLWNIHFLWNGGAEGARDVLSVIAGSVITVAGVSFSITLVALVQAASQFGPRLLRNFMRDRSNQAVLGTFIATFVYCLLVLRTVRLGDADTFVPDLSISVGLLFALASLGVLIFFLHHILSSLQAESVVQRAAAEFAHVAENVFPAKKSPQSDRPQEKEAANDRDKTLSGWSADHRAVVARASRYVQAIDEDGLVRIAAAHDLGIRLTVRPGDFVLAKEQIASIHPESRASESVCEKVCGAMSLGRNRTLDQDVKYPINQLVEIAVRALSPGVNEPFTAMSVFTWLADGLAEIARRPSPDPFHHDKNGKLRLVTRVPTFADVVDACFAPVRADSARSTAVSMKLLDVLARIGRQCRSLDHRQVILSEAEKLHDETLLHKRTISDQRLIDAAYEALRCDLAERTGKDNV